MAGVGLECLEMMPQISNQVKMAAEGGGRGGARRGGAALEKRLVGRYAVTHSCSAGLPTLRSPGGGCCASENSDLGTGLNNAE